MESRPPTSLQRSEINESEAWTLTWLLRHEQEATLPPSVAIMLSSHWLLMHSGLLAEMVSYGRDERMGVFVLKKNKKHLKTSQELLVKGCLGQLATKRGLIKIHPCISFIFTVESVHYVTWQLKTQRAALSGKCVTWQRRGWERTRRHQKKQSRLAESY